MPPRVFIHIGSGKAGSSALQHFFECNAKAFEAKGYAYPPAMISAEMKKEMARNRYHVGNGWALVSPNPKYTTDEINQFIESIDKNKNLVFSSEHLLHVSEENLERIRGQFDGFSFRIIYYVRRIDSAFQSLLNNQIQLGNISFAPENFDEVAKKLLRAFPTFGHLNRFANCFGKENIVIRPYEKGQFVGGNIFSDFLAILGLKLDDGFVVPEGENNPSMPREYLEIRRILTDPALIENKDIQHLFSTTLFELAHRSGQGGQAPAALISPRQKRDLIEKFSPFYEHLASEYLNRDDGKLFYEPLPDPDVPWEYPNEISIEKVVLFFGALFEKRHLEFEDELHRLRNQVKELSEEIGKPRARGSES